MDVNTLRIVATLVTFATFLGIMAWTFARANRSRFEEAAQLPFDEADNQAGQTTNSRATRSELCSDPH